MKLVQVTLLANLLVSGHFTSLSSYLYLQAFDNLNVLDFNALQYNLLPRQFTSIDLFVA